MKKIIACILLGSSVLLNCMAFAAPLDSFSVDGEKETLELEGSFENGKKNDIITFELLHEGEGDLSSRLVTFMQMNANSDGGYKTEINMEGCQPGYYIVRLRHSGKIYEEKIFYSTMSAKEYVVSQLVSFEDPKALEEYLDLKNPESEPINILEISDESISSAKPERLSEILFSLISEDDEVSADEAAEYIVLSSALACFEEGKLSVYDYREITELDGDFVKAYEEKLKASAKESFTSKYLSGKKLDSKEAVNRAFCDGVAVAVLNGASTADEIGEAIELFGDYIGIKSLQGLSAAKRNKLFEKIADSDYDDIGKMRDGINRLIDDAIKENQSGAKPSGGGGSGGSKAGGAAASNSVYNTSKEDKAPSLDEIAPSEDFSDMENYGWAIDAVSYLKKAGIISGTGNNKFSPQREIKREELLKMLVLMLESEGVKTEYEYEDIFEDVPSNSWYAEYVLKGYRAGITGGISESLFGAGKSVTREDAAVFVSRTAALMGRKFENNKDMEFSDKDGISEYAKPAVSEFCGAGIINGFEDNTFRPKAFCTRAQICRIIYSALGKENLGE